MNNLHFDVRYYDDHQRQILQNVVFPHSVDDLVQTGLDVSRAEFFTYMLFREQRMHIPGWQTYSELRQRVPTRNQQIIDNFDLSGGTVRSLFAGAGSLDNAMVEGAGVGSGLVLANALFGTHSADWEKIPVASVPTSDFQIASDGARYIQVECKGTVVADGNISSSISHHKQDIDKKKRSARADGSRNVLLGVIGAFPTPPNMNAILRVMDPEPIAMEMPANKYKVLARLSYYGRLARAISDSRFVAVVRNRIQAIAASSAWEHLDGMPFQKNSGEPYHFDTNSFPGHTLIPRIDAVGRLYVIGGQLLFDGVLLHCLNLASKQDFSSIAGYESRREKELLTFDGYLPKEMVRELDLAEGTWHPVRGTNLIRARVKALIYVLQSGRAVGLGEIC